MTLTTNGRLGIGTTSPQWHLDVDDGMAVRGQLAVDSGPNEIIGDLASGDESQDKLQFWTSDQNRMTFDENGNLGIGTPSDQIDVKELGYLFVYLSYDNESASWVHFDEFKITYAESPVVQVNSYYPYGMTAYSWIRDGEEDSKFLYQGKEFDPETGMHDFGSRQYSADLGRWFAKDPQSQFSSPYLAMGNNPVSTIDPDGEFAFFVVAGAILYQGVRSGVKAHKAGGSFFMDGFIPAFMFSAGASMASAGIGSVFSGLPSTFAVEAGRAVAHGAVGAGFSEITGGKPASGFLTGFAGSLVGSGLNNAPVAVQLAGASLSGGIASGVTGGDFWDGFIYAAILTSANHVAHWAQALQDGRVVLDLNGNILRRDEGATLIYVDMGSGKLAPFHTRLARDGKMSPEGFAKGLLNAVNGMKLPEGTFDSNKLHNAKFSLAISTLDGRVINYNDGVQGGVQAHFTRVDGFYKITYQHINGRSLTIQSLQSVLGVHEYYAHGVLGLVHPRNNDTIKRLVAGYPY